MVNQNNILPRVLPFAIYIFFLALSDYSSLFLNGLSIGAFSFDAKWLYLVKVTLVLATLLYFWRDYIELTTKPAVVDFAHAVLAGLLVFLVWILPYPAWAGVNNGCHLA
jgi:hypothetical protein